MKKMLLTVLGMALLANLAFAQQQIARSYTGPTQNPKSKKSVATAKQTSSTTRSRGEVYIGYSGTAAPTTSGTSFNDNRKAHHGVQTSVTINANRFVGLKGDFSVGFQDQKEGSLTRRTTITNILGGVQLKDNESESVVQPFAHALIGAVNFRQRFKEQGCANTSSGICGSLLREWGLAGAFGGGLDFKVAENAGIRFGGDYNPIRLRKEVINNFRFGVGVVFK